MAVISALGIGVGLYWSIYPPPLSFLKAPAEGSGKGHKTLDVVPTPMSFFISAVFVLVFRTPALFLSIK